MTRLSDRPVRTVFDVSFLGRVHAGPQRSQLRGGIFRVVEQSVRALSVAPGLELALGAHTLLGPSLAYVSGHPELCGIHFPVPARTRIGTRILARAVAEHQRAGVTRTGALPARIANRVAGDLNQVLDRISHQTGLSALARADVFHSPFNPLPRASDRLRRVRYFLTVYDVIPLVRPEVGGMDWLREILDSIGPDDHVLAISAHTKQDLLNAVPALAPDRVSVTPLAADPALFRPCTDAARIAAVRAKYGVPDGPYVLTVGTLAPHKNIPLLLRAFADLVHAERLGDLRLVLAGAKGWGYEAIFQELDRLGTVSDRVHFTGYVDDADLAPLYSGALVFVYPSYYEGFGLPPLEAMQCGTPVITGNAASLPEVVGDAGLMVDPLDQDAFAQAIFDVYRDPAKREALAARSLARAREFTWARYADETVAAYRRAL